MNMRNLHIGLTPLVSLIAGILILIAPRLLSYIVATSECLTEWKLRSERLAPFQCSITTSKYQYQGRTERRKK